MRNQKNNIIQYFVLIILILNGGTIIKITGFTALFQLVSLGIVMVTYIVSKKHKRIHSGFLLISISLFLFLSLLQSIKFNDISSIISIQVVHFIVLIILSVFLWSFFNEGEYGFSKVLNNILFILIVHAILSVFIFAVVPSKNVGIRASNGDPFYTIGYLFFQRGQSLFTGADVFVPIELLSFTFNRAQGIFWEPSVFSVYANIFIFFNLFIFKKYKKTLIGVFAIVLSWSSTGFIVLFVQLSYFAIINFKVNLKNIFIVGIFTSLTLFLSLFFIVDNLDAKFFGANAGSAYQRAADTIAALNVISNNPIIGVGVDFDRVAKEITNAKPELGILDFYLPNNPSVENKFSNSLLRIIVSFGIPVGLILLFALKKQNLIPEHKVLFAITTFLGVSAAPILLLTFHFSIVLNGLKNWIYKKESKKN